MIPRELQVQVMKFRTEFLIIVMIVFFVTLHTEYAFSQQPSACQPNTICVHPGDILKYSATLGRVNSSDTFSFGDMPDSNHIQVIEQNQANGSEIKNYTMILSLKTGYDEKLRSKFHYFILKSIWDHYFFLLKRTTQIL